MVYKKCYKKLNALEVGNQKQDTRLGKIAAVTGEQNVTETEAADKSE